MVAAEKMNVAPWELEKVSSLWKNRALLRKAAETQARTSVGNYEQQWEESKKALGG